MEYSKSKKYKFSICYCASLEELPDISKWDTRNVVDMNNIFHSCSSLKKSLIYQNGI